MRIGSKLFHNIDNEQFVIMDETTGNGVILTSEEARHLSVFIIDELAREARNANR